MAIGRYSLRINNKKNLEDLLQEIYDDSMRQLTLINDNINELKESTKLSDETVTIDGKAKYAKAIHDYTTDKEKAIARKMDVAKLMGEILKFNGDVTKVLTDKQIEGNIDDLFSAIRQDGEIIKQNEEESNVQEELYITNKKPKKNFYKKTE